MKKILMLTIALLLTIAAQGQTVTLVGQVQDAFLKRPLVAKISVYEMDSTTCVLDSVHVEGIENDRGYLLVALYEVPVSPVEHDYLIRAELSGYEVAWQKVSVTDTSEKEVQVPLIKMRRAQHIALDEVVVTTTKIKMFYRGDTLIYDATAFNLPDGSMLDDLIRQMPGVTMNDGGEIFVNGKKVDELLLNSRSFFGGNKQILLENLPYYTVKHIKVYHKKDKRDEVMGRDDAPKQYVMDVNLKQEYQRGYIANVEGAMGTHSRWLGRMFGLGFTDLYRFTLLGNVNNVNETQHIGKTGNWTPDRRPRSLITTRSVRSEMDYQSKDQMIEETFRTEFVSSKEDTEMRQSREQFLMGRNPLSVTERTGRSNNWRLALDNGFTMYAPFYMMLSTNFNYGKRDGTSNSMFQQWGDTLTASMRTVGMSESTSWNGMIDLLSVLKVGKEHLTYVAKVEHSSDKSESASHYDTRYYATPSLEQRYNVGDYDKQMTAGELSLDHIGKLTDRMQFRIKNRTRLSRTATHDYLYHPDTLLLASQLDALAAITDVNNSYDSKFRSLTNTAEISFYTRNEQQPDKKSSTNWQFGLQVPFTRHTLDYQRGSIDTLATNTTLFVTPWLSYGRKTAKNHELHLNVRHTETTANIYDMIDYRDDSNPLVVKLGTLGLKGNASTDIGVEYFSRGSGHSRKQWNVSASFDYHHRDVSQSVVYNPTSGVYTYKPENVSGAYIANAQFQISNSIGEKRFWTWQNGMDANYHHSLDHSMLAGDTESHVNAVNTLTLHDGAYIQYNKGTLNIRATGDIRWRHSEGKMYDFETLNATDFQYGLSARYTLPRLNTTLSADGNMYSRRGYGSSELNTDDFVLNASISQPFFKGKLIARIEAFDLLHQLSNTQYTVNAQGRTETWYRSLPHYVMAHLVYHWNKNPKKK
ncbi:MAG: hypothetical protein IJ693_04160 [Bacteroidaceae bacterium]|nr:hypothetical protein [Bacteroidaceae bacterium]